MDTLRIHIDIDPEMVGLRGRRELVLAFCHAVEDRVRVTIPGAEVRCRQSMHGGTDVSGLDDPDEVEAIRERIASILEEFCREPEAWAAMLPEQSDRDGRMTPEPMESEAEVAPATELESSPPTALADPLTGAVLYRRGETWLAFLPGPGLGVRLGGGPCAVILALPGAPFDRKSYRRRHGDPGRPTMPADLPEDVARRLRGALAAELSRQATTRRPGLL